eukprot:CAMPEP_0119292714 /NCGR_PEP_ID=MMETSP1329-20130426/44703_1 /TAXON_ID=114041 /ORGANISM="Genus nov. species nov., Strain RCC1024" /LENGTH=109 /DNA_ID=CAMNT_0007293561 /DNA_START=1074 /DNA_END=1402 /DNA_ORIENTATION=+
MREYPCGLSTYASGHAYSTTRASRYGAVASSKNVVANDRSRRGRASRGAILQPRVSSSAATSSGGTGWPDASIIVIASIDAAASAVFAMISGARILARVQNMVNAQVWP